MKYDIVLFDLDGTTLDTSEGVINAWKHTIREVGIPVPPDADLRRFIGPPLRDSFTPFCSDEDQMQRSIAAFRKYYSETGQYQTTAYPGIKELLVALRSHGIRTAVSTLKRQENAEECLRHCGVSEYFDVVVGNDGDRERNTKRLVMEYALKQLGATDPSRVVLIGDSNYDAVGAAQLGVDLIAVTYGFGFGPDDPPEQYHPVLIADNLKAVQEFLLS